MDSVPMRAVVTKLCRLAGLAGPATRGDRQLLDSYLNQSDETAFEALVRRYGAMVLGICRRILRHEHDAEDAFQATFVVLMRKGASITQREHLGSWLYGVAFRIAVRARQMS